MSNGKLVAFQRICFFTISELSVLSAGFYKLSLKRRAQLIRLVSMGVTPHKS